MNRIVAVVLLLVCNAAFAGQIAIVSPRSGETVVDPDGRIPVTLNTSLASGERVRVLLNGVAIQAAGQGDRMMLLNVDRGEHRLEAEVVDHSGSVVATSLPVVFVVNRVAAGGGGRSAPPGTPPPGDGSLPTEGPVGSPSVTNPPSNVGRGNPGATTGTGNPGAATGAGNAGANVGGGNPGAAVGTGNPGATVGRPAGR